MENIYGLLTDGELDEEIIKKAKREKLPKGIVKDLINKADRKEKIIYLTDKVDLQTLMALIYTD